MTVQYNKLKDFTNVGQNRDEWDPSLQSECPTEEKYLPIISNCIYQSLH